VLDLVRELKRQGATIVMATHEMSFAREVADRIVFLEHGVVVEQGPPSQVFDAPQEAATAEFLARVRH
jgi:polar amino acid transport system ATP-binding protein